jgi:hypothetical protein
VESIVDSIANKAHGDTGKGHSENFKNNQKKVFDLNGACGFEGKKGSRS